MKFYLPVNYTAFSAIRCSVVQTPLEQGYRERDGDSLGYFVLIRRSARSTAIRVSKHSGKKFSQ
jgi:hypothetical protein